MRRGVILLPGALGAVSFPGCLCIADEGECELEVDVDVEIDVEDGGEGEGEGEGEPGAVLASDDDDAFVEVPFDFRLLALGEGTLSDDRERFSGDIFYYQHFVLGDELVNNCNLDLEFEGSEYSGECNDCTFAFSMESEVVADRSAADCELINPFFTYLHQPESQELVWIYWEEFPDLRYACDYDGSDCGYQTYRDVLQTGFYYTEEEYEEYGLYYQELAEDGPFRDRGAFARFGDEISWYAGYHETGTFTQRNHYNPDYYEGLGFLGDGNYGGYSYLGDLDQYGQYIDGWEVDLDAGDTLFVSIDNTDPDAACDMLYYVNGPAGNTILFADDSFACAIEPLVGFCPSGFIEAPFTGTYSIWVGNEDFCTGDNNLYALFLRKE